MSKEPLCKYGQIPSVCHSSPMDCDCILDESMSIDNRLDEIQKLTEIEYYCGSVNGKTI